VRVLARDGYAVSLTLSQVQATYPGGLKAIIAYQKGGSPLTGDEGGLRLIVPQSTPGKKDQGGDANTPLCARMIYAVEVVPVPVGEQPPSAGEVPEGSLAVYGAVSTQTDQPQQTTPGGTPTNLLLSQASLGYYTNWLIMSIVHIQPLAAILLFIWLLNWGTNTP
jgi:hypothetical protein